MRRALFVLLGFLAFIFCALALLPFWLGAPLSLLGKRAGVTYERYERLGYQRFVLHGVRWQRPGVTIEAGRLEVATPLRWVLEKNNSGPWRIDDWKVTVVPTTSTPAPNSVQGWKDLRRQLEGVVRQLDAALPPLSAHQGKVVWPQGALTVDVVRWNRRSLSFDTIAFRDVHVSGAVLWPEREGLSARVESKDQLWALAAQSVDATSVTADLRVRGQPAKLQAEFGDVGWLPVEATLNAIDWKLSGEEVRLAPVYRSVAGAFSLTWKDARLGVSLRADAEPVEGSAAPPLKAVAQGEGDLNRLRIEALSLSGPGVQATLAQPVEIERTVGLRTPETQFDARVDLAQMPWFQGTGVVAGMVRVEARSAGAVSLRAKLSGQDLKGDQWAFSRVEGDALLEWPRLTVAGVRATVAEGETLTIEGGYDFREKSLQPSQVKGEITRVAVARWIPEALTFERMSISAQASGPLSALTHHGELSVVEPAGGRVKASRLDLKWQGKDLKSAEVTAHLVSQGSDVQLAAALTADSADVNRLEWTKSGEDLLRSSRPFTVAWKPELKVTGLVLEGGGRAVTAEVQSGATGRVAISARQIRSDLWRDFYAAEGLPWAIETGELTGEWARGPLRFSLRGKGHVGLEDERTADVDVNAAGTERGVQIAQLNVGISGRPVVAATGQLPVFIESAPTWGLRIERTQPLVLNLITEKEAQFWSRVGRLTGLLLVDPVVQVNLSGTWQAPAGNARIDVEKMGWPQKDGKDLVPPMERIQATLLGDGKSITLETFSANVAGQPVRAAARLPLPADVTRLNSDELRAWLIAHAEAELQLKDAELAAVAPFAQAWIAPTGKLNVDLKLSPGLAWEGSLRVTDAATRPLGPLGVLQSIQADLAVSGHTLRVNRVEARAGGQPVTLTGSADYHKTDGWVLDLALKGNQLPFLRQTGFLVRGDVDLKVKTESPTVTRVTGKAYLRESLFLADIRNFIPRGSVRTAPSRRPPYFSVEALPFAAWQLGVEVEGNRFLRLRTPIFAGLASARFRLQGTLAEPVAIGEAIVHEGQVLFPFASLQVQQGAVSLTELDPFEPRISLVAVSRRLGYDLRMELSGTASEPNLMFTSSPPLDSEQVLRLVMAGEAPQREVVYSGQQRAMRLGTYLGQSLAGQLGSDPGKAERFSLTTGERVSRDGKETYVLEVPLDERWSLMGEYDEFDDYNVGVKWRVLQDRSLKNKQSSDGAVEADPAAGHSGKGKEPKP